MEIWGPIYTLPFLGQIINILGKVLKKYTTAFLEGKAHCTVDRAIKPRNSEEDYQLPNGIGKSLVMKSNKQITFQFIFKKGTEH